MSPFPLPIAPRRLLVSVAVLFAACASDVEPASHRSGPPQDDLPTNESLAGAASSLRFAYVRARQARGAEEPRFHVRRSAGVLAARSPERGVRGVFETHGLALESDNGLRGRLRPRAIRCDETMREALATPWSRADSPHRVERRIIGGTLDVTEWVESGPLGLEQGFDVIASSGCDTLSIELEAHGFGVERVGDAVRLTGDEGAFRYAQLFAVDAAGQPLPARFVVNGSHIALDVEAAGAVFPVVVDPLVYVEDRKLTLPRELGSDGAGGDDLGRAVAMAGDLAVVGAPGGAVGPSPERGAAYVFVRSGATWTIEAKLVASDGLAGDQFGASVAIAGETILVGAPHNDAAGVDGGSAYVFTRSAGTWLEEQKLVSADGAPDDLFGTSVALDGDFALIGAPQDDDIGFSSGAAYVFARVGGAWAEQRKLRAGDEAAGDEFGWSVALSGDTALIGARYDDDAGTNSGSAYVFVRSGGGWREEQKLAASDSTPGDIFGFAVAIDGDTVVIGADGDDDGGMSSGAAYVFVRSGGTWTEQQKLTAGDGGSFDRFGTSVAVSGDTVLVGMPGDDGLHADSGAVYVFARDDSLWSERVKLTGSDGGSAAQLGWSVALSGTSALAGSPRADAATRNSGAAYVFVSSGGVWSEEVKLDAGAATAWALGESVALDADTALVGSREGAYVFVRSGTGWVLEQVLSASDAAPNDGFGSSVALDGDTALVGAPWDDDGDAETGSVYVFVRSSGSWSQQQKLTAVDGEENDRLGTSVALFGDTALVGAPLEDDSGLDAGAAYVFVRSGGVWTEQQKLVAGGAGDRLGTSVALDGDTALLGVPRHDVVGSTRGAAYVFVRSGVVWLEQQVLRASDGMSGDGFGATVALSGEIALIGAAGDDDAGSESGSAYVFVRSAGRWTQEQKLSATDGEPGDRFGASVALSDRVALVGVPWDDVADVESGAVYAYARVGDAWVEQLRLSASDGGRSQWFGSAVALDGRDTLIGAPRGHGEPPFGKPNEGVAYVGRLLLAAGDECGSGMSCATGFCVDGVCCDTACGGGLEGDCQACSLASGGSVDGTCTPSTGNVCDDGLACTASDSCTDGSCGGDSACVGGTACTETGGEAFACAPCPAGTFSIDGSGAFDCEPCSAGTWSMAGATSCTSWSSCAPGSQVETMGSDTADRSCAPCAAGTFSSTVNASACEPCPAGSFAAVPGAVACSPWRTCGAMEYEAAAPSDTSDRVCEAVTECGATEYESTPPTAMSDRECTPCSMCGEGEMEVRACSATADTVCASTEDAGALQPDGGVSGSDAGSVALDAGSMVADAGAADDAGVSEDASASIDAGGDAGSDDGAGGGCMAAGAGRSSDGTWALWLLGAGVLSRRSRRRRTPRSSAQLR